MLSLLLLVFYCLFIYFQEAYTYTALYNLVISSIITVDFVYIVLKYSIIRLYTFTLSIV